MDKVFGLEEGTLYKIHVEVLRWYIRSHYISPD